MKKITSGLIVLILGLSFFIPVFKVEKAKAATDTVTMTTTVQEYLIFSITAGDPVAFGNLTPGTPICFATGVVASATTNAANGYTLGASDAVAGTNSALLHTDAATYVQDMTTGTITTPVVWGAEYGQGFGLYAADTNKEAKWGTGTTVCDALNKYAAIPQAATTAHTVTGYHAGADTSSWSFKIDVQNTQKTGSYSGNMTFTATAVLS